MTKLFGRKLVIQAGRRIFSSPADLKPILKMGFNVKADSATKPNVATVTIFNLKKESRAQFVEGDPLIISAGYVDSFDHIFSGDIKFVTHSKQGVNRISTIDSGDGANAFSTARMNVSYAGGTSMKKMLLDAASKLGVGLGNTASKVLGSGFAQGIERTTAGIVNNGRVSDILDKLTGSTGLNWSIQDGQLQLLEDNETTQETAIILSSGSGMIGTPEINEKGIIKVRSQLRGGFKPGRLVNVRSLEIDGFYKIKNVVHVGDTWGSDWYSQLEAKPI